MRGLPLALHRAARATGSRLLQSLFEGAGAVAALDGERGLVLANWLGERLAGSPLAWGAPAAYEVEAVFGALGSQEIARIRREIAVLECRNVTLRRLVAWRGVASLHALMEPLRAAPLLELRRAGTPVIVVGWHAGPQWAVSASLSKLGVPALIPTGGRLPPLPAQGSVRYWPLARNGSDAAFLKEALRTLDSGGVVALHLDAEHATGPSVRVLGRRIPVGVGPAWLARRCGARLVPVTRRWVGLGPRIEVVFHEPLPQAALDHALLESAAAWFDAWLRAHPGGLYCTRVRRFARLPLAEDTRVESA